MRLPLADIPPPPPEFPMVGVPIPHPAFILIAGIFLSCAVMMIGKKVVSEGENRKLWINRAIIVIVVLTMLMATWSLIAYSTHQKRRSRWRPGGPVRQPAPAPVEAEPLEEAINPQAPVNDRPTQSQSTDDPPDQ